MPRQKFIAKRGRSEKKVKEKSKAFTFPRILKNSQKILLPVSLALFRFFVVIIACVIVLVKQHGKGIKNSRANL